MTELIPFQVTYVQTALMRMFMSENILSADIQSVLALLSKDTKRITVSFT